MYVTSYLFPLYIIFQEYLISFYEDLFLVATSYAAVNQGQLARSATDQIRSLWIAIWLTRYRTIPFICSFQSSKVNLYNQDTVTADAVLNYAIWYPVRYWWRFPIFLSIDVFTPMVIRNVKLYNWNDWRISSTRYHRDYIDLVDVEQFYLIDVENR